jgi:N-formylglutamate deformylase
VPPAAGRALHPEAREVPDTDWHLERLYDFAKDMGASMLAWPRIRAT